MIPPRTFCEKLYDCLPECFKPQPMKRIKQVRIAPEPTVLHPPMRKALSKRNVRLNSMEGMVLHHLIVDQKFKGKEA